MQDRRREYMVVTQQICPKCHKPIFPVQSKDRHHAAVHDTDGNNLNFPYFTRSILASLIMHSFCHLSDPGIGRIPQAVAEAFETFLSSYAALVKLAQARNVKVPLVATFKELEIIKDEIITGKRK